MDLNRLPKLTVSATPHIRSKVTTQSIMRDVIIALLPAAVMGIALFGPTAALLIVISVASSEMCIRDRYVPFLCETSYVLLIFYF